MTAGHRLSGATEPWRTQVCVIEGWSASLPEAVRENEEVVPVNAVSTWVLSSGVTVGR
jgi:hypothetical protein